MKHTHFKLTGFLPLLGMLCLLSYIAYWQLAQYKKLEQIELRLETYQSQVDNLMIEHQKYVESLRVQDNNTSFPKSDNISNKPDKQSDKKRIEQVTEIPPTQAFSIPLKQQLPITTAALINPPEIKTLPFIPQQVPEPAIEEEILLTDERVEDLYEETLPINSDSNNSTNSVPTKIKPDAEIELALKRCTKHIKAYRLTSGISGNAYDCFRAILQKDKNNALAIAGIIRVEKTYEQLIYKYLKLNNAARAQTYIEKIKKINPQSSSITRLQKEISQITNNRDNGSKMIKASKFVTISAGCFSKIENTKETSICIEKDFLMGKYEVTQQQWIDTMGENPSRFTDCGINCPIENISWFDIQEFIRQLNKNTGKQYRLPTENEWEYSARAGSSSLFSFGEDANNLSKYANFCDTNCPNSWRDNSQNDAYKLTSPVGNYNANAFGLYDMHGNVWEWVSDQNNELHIYKGGSWGDNYLLCQSSSRGEAKPDLHVSGIGFRLAQDLEQDLVQPLVQPLIQPIAQE